jgi:hypothetical protein
MNAHPLNQRGCDPFGRDHSFIRRDIEMPVLRTARAALKTKACTPRAPARKGLRGVMRAGSSAGWRHQTGRRRHRRAQVWVLP